MDILVWVAVIFFASLGMAQVLEWMLAFFRRKQPHNGYYVVPLYDNAETLEIQVRHSLSQSRWNGCQPVFVDMGLTREAQTMCEALLEEADGVPVCRMEELPEALRTLEAARSVF